MSLSIIIVNYRSTHLICDCIASVLRFAGGAEGEFLVVDNDSGDDGKSIITTRFPFVQWIDMGYNAGFARANNAGIKASTGTVLLLLNPDTIAIDDSIPACYSRLVASQHSGAGVQLLDAAQQPQISGSFFVKGGLNHLLPLPYWGNVIRWMAYKANTKVPHAKGSLAVEEVDWISGAFLMVKRAAIEEAGLLDEDFFLYGEEVEWCSRLKKSGPLCIYGDLKIIHLEGATINKDQQLHETGYYNLWDKKGLQLMVSNHLRVRKQYGTAWFMFLLLNYTFGVALFFIASGLQMILGKRGAAERFRKSKGFAFNVGRLWRLAPSIIRNKPRFYKMF
ncbi:MAG TPA: glycosyltransferase family 2 protein [Flavisolibacter sp.]|nr:glycosyltransferase family 2 protein [Flavisolibacter sp.]